MQEHFYFIKRLLFPFIVVLKQLFHKQDDCKDGNDVNIIVFKLPCDVQELSVEGCLEDNAMDVIW